MVLKFRCLEPWLGEKWGYYVTYTSVSVGVSVWAEQ